MKIALCDDDEKELSNIRSLLDSYQKTHNIPFTYQEYHSSCELALRASKERFDIYLLDILMPHMTGMQLAREIRTFDHAADIIFLTTSSDFAVESYTVKATNYLMKPVSSNAFFAAMDDILRVKTQEQGHFLVLKSRIGVHKVPLSELIYVEAQNRKVIYYTSGREQIVCTELFSSVCNSLLQHREFIQVHRSFLVNMNYIRSIGTMDMCLHNGMNFIPVRNGENRRIMICASEDVGNADPNALTVAVSAAQAVERLGMPEARIVLAQAVTYVASAPKSNAAYMAVDQALESVRNHKIGAVPNHLRDAHYKGAAKLGHGIGYKYAHDYPDHYVKQQYLPDELLGTTFYEPTENGYEKNIKEYLERIRK